MKRQNVRKLILFISLLLFPVTLYYFSPALIFMAGFEGIINGSFIVFAGMLLGSVFFGRVFCGFLCPAGGAQECLLAAKGTKPRQGWRNSVKFVIWGFWLAAVVLTYALHGVRQVDFFYQTDHGISIANVYGYIIYYGILLLVVLPGLISGKRAFCHYFCWMAPFMVLGTRLRRLLRLPGLHVAAAPGACVNCGKCGEACPMSVDVQKQAQMGGIVSLECIQCGACVDACPKQVLRYSFKRQKEGRKLGQGKEDGMRPAGPD